MNPYIYIYNGVLRKTATLFFCLFAVFAKAQNSDYQRYIERYASLAVDQMHRHKIPASITLAQGLLESGAGKGDLARRANNHFGIKVGGSWTGPYILKDDDARNEKFRVYGSVKESYEDHSLFLKKPRYASLFNLKMTDYKAWAHGLKRCGYATNPRYAYSLIDIIERYNLHHFDKLKHGHKQKHGEAAADAVPQISDEVARLRECNGVLYVIAVEGDTYASLAKKYKTREKRLRRYNDEDRTREPQPGTPVFLEQKKRKASRKHPSKTHTVQAGQSMHSISQTYAIRLDRLYKLNQCAPDYVPRPGDVLKIR